MAHGDDSDEEGEEWTRHILSTDPLDGKAERIEDL
jgi:hypothetical protein